MKKMNNKGFSLVELIVVVLIMAIIAVALAPQVMKWVENSRKSNDIENYNALVEAANVAGTNEDVIKELAGTAGSAIITMSAGLTTGNTTISGSHPALASAILTTLPTWSATKIEGTWNSGSTPFTIGIEYQTDGNGIKVTKIKAPEKNFD